MAANIQTIKVSSDFLETNSMCHDSPFSSFAELIDNAYDAQANILIIEHKKIKGLDCVIFTDDGNGLDKNGLINMLSFGFSQKPEESIIEPIGRYGNGFKSSSMRLGDDVLVFSKTINDDCSVGFLSKRYNQNNETILIPTCSWKRHTDKKFENLDTSKHSFNAIVKNSILIESEKDIKDIFNGINTFGFYYRTQGTIIVIYNLKKKDNKQELDFEKPNDIRIKISDEDEKESKTKNNSTFSSLRNYLELLYLSSNKTMMFNKKSNLIIKIEKKQIESIYEKKLKNIKSHLFKINNNDVEMKIGEKISSKDFPDICTMIYCKNRLIESIGKKNTKGKCSLTSISIVQADFLQPKHNKQSFVKDDNYKNLRKKINEYNTKYMDDYINRNDNANNRKFINYLNKKKIYKEDIDYDASEDDYDTNEDYDDEDYDTSEDPYLPPETKKTGITFQKGLTKKTTKDVISSEPKVKLEYCSIVTQKSKHNKSISLKLEPKTNISENLAKYLWVDKDVTQKDLEIETNNSKSETKKRKNTSLDKTEEVSKICKINPTTSANQQLLSDELNNLRDVCIEIHQDIQEIKSLLRNLSNPSD